MADRTVRVSLYSCSHRTAFLSFGSSDRDRISLVCRDRASAEPRARRVRRASPSGSVVRPPPTGRGK
eukprot:3470569-Prymnesium_polylepis.2